MDDDNAVPTAVFSGHEGLSQAIQSKSLQRSVHTALLREQRAV